MSTKHEKEILKALSGLPFERALEIISIMESACDAAVSNYSFRLGIAIREQGLLSDDILRLLHSTKK